MNLQLVEKHQEPEKFKGPKKVLFRDIFRDAAHKILFLKGRSSAQISPLVEFAKQFTSLFDYMDELLEKNEMIKYGQAVQDALHLITRHAPVLAEMSPYFSWIKGRVADLALSNITDIPGPYNRLCVCMFALDMPAFRLQGARLALDYIGSAERVDERFYFLTKLIKQTGDGSELQNCFIAKWEKCFDEMPNEKRFELARQYKDAKIAPFRRAARRQLERLVHLVN